MGPEDFIPPFFHPTSVGMQEGSQKPRHKLYGGIAASVALHVIIAVALFVRLPAAEMQPPQEESVSVEIVPPPEEQPAEEKPAEQEQALNLTMPEQEPEEEKPQEQAPPPPEPAQQPAQEAKTEPPPPPPAPEEKAEAEQPPPAEVPPPEEQAAEPPPQQQPEPEPAAEGAAQNNEQQEANGRPLPVLRPVFEFGEDSKGSGISPDGNAAEEGEVAKAEDRDPEIPSEEAEETSEAEPSETEAAETGAAAPPLPQDVAPPSLETANANPLATSDDGTIEGILADIAAEPVEKPPEEEPVEDKASKDKPMTEAKRLFSQTDTSDASATTAMGNIPRGVRASQLCTTELREQLRHGSPAYQPEILPSYSLPKGNILDIRSAAFRAGAQWYDVRFRCEIDDGATKVVSFGLEVGGAVPRSQWKVRRFPEF